MLLLGDILYHGPRNDLPEEYNPRKVSELLNAYKDDIYAVQGNCDADVDQLMLDFPIMTQYCIIESGGRMIFATHGHVYDEQHLPPMHAGDIFLQGHTHLPKCEKVGEVICMNPGSVSIPKENTQHGYMIIEDGRFSWKDLSGQLLREEMFS